MNGCLNIVSLRRPDVSGAESCVVFTRRPPFSSRHGDSAILATVDFKGYDLESPCRGDVAGPGAQWKPGGRACPCPFSSAGRPFRHIHAQLIRFTLYLNPLFLSFFFLSLFRSFSSPISPGFFKSFSLHQQQAVLNIGSFYRSHSL